MIDNEPTIENLPIEVGQTPAYSDTTKAFLDSFDDEHSGMVLQDVVTYFNEQWMDISANIAAMFIGLLMLSGIAYAAVQMVRQTQQQVQTETTTSVAGSSQSAHDTRIDEDDSAQNKPLLYEDAELATILSDIATFHQLEPVYKNEECKHIRLYFTWDRRSSIDDIINTFNKFERIHITRDNKKLIVE